MNLLFVHQNFPGQFRHLAPALAARGDRVVALTMNDAAALPGVTTIRTHLDYANATDGHPWTRDFDAKVIRAHATLKSARGLAAQGFVPDAIVAHPGWGESLFLKQLWPQAKLGIYCEYFYSGDNPETGFDPEFPVGDALENACRLQVRSTTARLHFDLADAAIAPTRWQADSFPQPFRSRISVVHEGVDTDLLAPGGEVSLQVGPATSLRRGDEVITFVNRNLEPYRGYHVFMRALPELLARRPRAHVLIVGGADVGYGPAPPPGETWRNHFFTEVAGRIDRSRVHFLGRVAYRDFRALLQLSSVHVYLTYPFVLSWSLIEAMSVGCAIVASDTGPVTEVVTDGATGRLFPFFDGAALVARVCELLDAPAERQRLGMAARALAVARFDRRTICLPQQVAWVDALASGTAQSWPAPPE